MHKLCASYIATVCTYCKQQVLRSTKLSRFTVTGFLAECRENRSGFVKLQYVFERAIEISRKLLRFIENIRENHESFVPRRICCLRYL